jgi:NAD(P)-dependent dehydrogenase (short-subunit alcohol dehydrogenase family)
MAPRVLITGATSGIGLVAARQFAAAGWTVFATGRSESKMAEAGKAFASRQVHFLVLDVDDARSIAAFRARVMELTEGYGVDVIVNNAGFARAAPMAEITSADLRAHFETNVFAVVALTQAFLPEMIARGQGRIINVSSSGGRMSLPFVGAYHGAKFAVEALSDAFRWELGPLGITVSVIEPGPVRTLFAGKLVESTRAIAPDSPYVECFEDVARMQKMAERHMLEPEVVVRDIMHAATARRPRARYMQPRLFALLIFLTHVFPGFVTDWVIGRMFSLKKIRRRALAKDAA